MTLPYSRATNENLYRISPEVQAARRFGHPIVALESTVITHGLPWPENLHLAQDMEKEVLAGACVPATLAVLDGKVKVGLSAEELERLASAPDARKVSVRDLASTCLSGKPGGLTVASSLYVAERMGIKVFATGGIGGVHRGGNMDISADLVQLSQSPVVLVCAGAKAILDLPATLELLETLNVPVIGYQSDDFPAFYSRSSGLKTPMRADSPEEVAQLAQTHWALGLKSAILLAVPVPEELALEREEVEDWIANALVDAEKMGVRGNAVTPFLLARLNQLSEGHSVKSNLALLRNNAHVAAQVARCMPQSSSSRREL